jgi:hypothetical protein
MNDIIISIYRNQNWDLAVSTDGIGLVNHLGRELPVSDRWEEVEGFGIDDLSAACRAALAKQLGTAAMLQEATERSRAEAPARAEARRANMAAMLADLNELISLR